MTQYYIYDNTKTIMDDDKYKHKIKALFGEPDT